MYNLNFDIRNFLHDNYFGVEPSTKFIKKFLYIGNIVNIKFYLPSSCASDI